MITSVTVITCTCGNYLVIIMFVKKKFQDGMVTFWGANVELKETKYVVVSY